MYNICMPKQENFPNQRKYSTLSKHFTTESTSLRRSTEIIQCLCNDINTITDIAEYLEYSTSTVHRLLQYLKKLKWIIQDVNNHKYYLGPMVTQLSSNYLSAHKYLILHSLREMTRLSAITEETISLTVMVQLHQIILHEISGTYNVKVTQENKELDYFYRGAASKVLLSQIDNREVKTMLKHINRDTVPDNALVDKEKLLAQLKKIKQTGICVTCGERISGALCISAPINNYWCPVSLNILGPEDQFKPNADHFTRELLASTNRISKVLALVSGKKGGDE